MPLDHAVILTYQTDQLRSYVKLYANLFEFQILVCIFKTTARIEWIPSDGLVDNYLHVLEM